MIFWKTALKGLAAGAALVGLLAGPAAAQQATVANDTGSTSIKGRTWDHFAERVSEKLGADFTMNVTHGEALYNQMSMVQAVQLGAIQFIAPVVGVYSGTFPKMSVLVLPYLLPSAAAIQEAMDDPEIGGVLLEDMRAQGLEPLAVWLNGPRDIGTSAAEPILTPEDAQGVKIRVPPGDNYVRAWELVGANVTTMAWGEVPTALSQGVIDAVEPVPNAWLSSHLYETARQITQINYIWDFYIVATNKAWWDGLDENVRSALTEAMEETTQWNLENTDAANTEAYEEIRAAGAEIHDLNAEQKQAWIDAMSPVWQSLGEPLVGPEVMQRLVAIGDKHRNADAGDVPTGSADAPAQGDPAPAAPAEAAPVAPAPAN